MTRTTNASLAQPDLDATNWNVLLNANFAALDGLAPLGGLTPTPTETPSASLGVRIAAGSYVNGAGAVVVVAAQTITVPASATTLLWLTDAGSLANGTTWPTSSALRLATVVAGTASVAIADARITLRSIVPALTPGAAIPSLVDATTGTVGSTLSDVGSTPTQATINANFASVGAKLNLILTALRQAGLIGGS